MKKKRNIILTIIMLMLVLPTSIPVFANQDHDENMYMIGIINSGAGGCDWSDFNRGILRMGWGSEFTVNLLYDDGTKNIYNNRVAEATWDAVMPDGTIIEPINASHRGYGHFIVPYEITGSMTVRGYIEEEIVAELTVVILTEYPEGKPLTGWRTTYGERYYIKDGGVLARGWYSIKGKWFYFNEDGVLLNGWQYLSWNGEDNWYYFDKDEQINVCGKMLKGWQKIENTWYYFHKDGSMASNEWINGYWLSGNGAWKYQPKGRWRKNSKGWWFEDERGWYPKGETVKINCVTYTFDEKGYLVE